MGCRWYTNGKHCLDQRRIPESKGAPREFNRVMRACDFRTHGPCADSPAPWNEADANTSTMEVEDDEMRQDSLNVPRKNPIQVLDEISQRVLWLAVRIVDAAKP